MDLSGRQTWAGTSRQRWLARCVVPVGVAALTWLIASSGSRHARAQPAPPPAPAPAPAPDADASGPGSGSGSSAEVDAAATLAALQTQAQVPMVRGGSLGIPAVFDSEGLQATIRSQAAGTSTTDKALPGTIGFDLFTRLGGLQLFKHFTVDVIAESYKQSLPHVDLILRPVLPRMVVTEMRDIGFRARLSSSRETQVTVIKNNALQAAKDGTSVKDSVAGQFFRHREISLTLGSRFLQRSIPGRDGLDFKGVAGELIVQGAQAITQQNTACKRKSADDIKKTHEDLTKLAPLLADDIRGRSIPSVYDRDAVEKQREQIETALESLSKIITTPDASAADKDVAAQHKALLHRLDTQLANATTGCNTDGYRISGFLGVSGTLLHTEAAHDDVAGTNTVDPLFKETRWTLGAEVQSSYTDGSTLLPRVGAYATLSTGTWKDRFVAPGLNQDIHPFQSEVGLYFSGHLIGGFDVLVSFVALKSYGGGQTTYLINVAPAIGAVLGGK